MSGLVESSADARSKTIGQNFRVRAWVTFNQDSDQSIIASGNVSSLTDQGDGNTQINFTQAMPDAKYMVAGSTVGSTDASYACIINGQGHANNALFCRVQSRNVSNSTLLNMENVSICIIR